MSGTEQSLHIANVHKAYGGVPAVRGVELAIRPGEFLTLLGPSGCGKTTLLRCISGLERIDKGSIALGDRMLSDATTGEFVRPEKRNIGMVFQSYALWPHMTVEQNVMYPLKMRGVAVSAARATAQQTLELVELGKFAKRPVGNLSGGQQQRVALARAIVAHPDMMLFDEPLSNLDASLRESMRAYILEAHRAAGGLSVYVTHDQAEALSLSDRIAVMFEGRVRQVGTPEEVYRRPADRRVAKFLGFDNFVEGVVIGRHGDWIDVALSDGMAMRAAGDAGTPGSPVSVAVRSNHFELTEDDGAPAGVNDWPGVVTAVRDAQSVIDYDIDCSGVALTVRQLDVAQRSSSARPKKGDRVRVRIHPDQAVVVAEEASADGRPQNPL